MIHDDWIFVEKYGFSAERIISWLLWYLIYTVGLSIYFWAAASAGIVIYSRWIVSRKNKE
jgi:hypothetical protein